MDRGRVGPATEKAQGTFTGVLSGVGRPSRSTDRSGKGQRGD
jgi:hypothetical protein